MTPKTYELLQASGVSSSRSITRKVLPCDPKENPASGPGSEKACSREGKLSVVCVEQNKVAILTHDSYISDSQDPELSVRTEGHE